MICLAKLDGRQPQLVKLFQETFAVNARVEEGDLIIINLSMRASFHSCIICFYFLTTIIQIIVLNLIPGVTWNKM